MLLKRRNKKASLPRGESAAPPAVIRRALRCFARPLALALCFKALTAGFLFSAAPAAAHGHSHRSEREIEASLEVFEKALSLSPELIEASSPQSAPLFYRIGGRKFVLNEGFWDLVRAWMRIYIQEIEKYCPCDLDPDLMIQEAKKYRPESFLSQKLFKPAASAGRSLSYKGIYITAKYGYTIAGVKIAAEAAETILSFSVGGKAIHVLCNAIDLMIFPLARQIQKHLRVFSNSRRMDSSGLLKSLKLIWLSRQIRKSQKRVFFDIHQALSFDEGGLQKVSEAGPSGYFTGKQRRRQWLERLKRRTDALFLEIETLEKKLRTESLSPKERKNIEKKIQKRRKNLQFFSQVKKKDFFGKRFKRSLFLLSRKSRPAYMQGSRLEDKITGSTILWPLSLQENVLEPALQGYQSPPEERPSALHAEASSSVLDERFSSQSLIYDEVRAGLAEEFLAKRRKASERLPPEEMERQNQAVQFFLEDIERIFSANLPSSGRLLRVLAVEAALSLLFTHYLRIAEASLSASRAMSFSERSKLSWIFGRFLNSVYDFSDFLSAAALIRNSSKIRFYKYEAMEKLLAFLDYLYEVQRLLKDQHAPAAEIFKKLQAQADHLNSLSLSREKNTRFNLLPFRNKQVQCKKLAEKYQ